MKHLGSSKLDLKLSKIHQSVVRKVHGKLQARTASGKLSIHAFYLRSGHRLCCPYSVGLYMSQRKRILTGWSAGKV
jgi:hypothetical protein